jgi:succinate dehydrogenase flavin-adding protein (antitoxin of CptAB toxin-antitoxin module)
MCIGNPKEKSFKIQFDEKYRGSKETAEKFGAFLEKAGASLTYEHRDSVSFGPTDAWGTVTVTDMSMNVAPADRLLYEGPKGLRELEALFATAQV